MISQLENAFEYVDDPSFTNGEFVLTIPAGINSKSELLQKIATAGRFPDYFGKNWDALNECLCDFEWVQERSIVLTHHDIPLHDIPTDCATYIQILRTAINSWSKPVDAKEKLFGIPHDFRVIFPTMAREMLDAL